MQRASGPQPSDWAEARKNERQPVSGQHVCRKILLSNVATYALTLSALLDVLCVVNDELSTFKMSS